MCLEWMLHFFDLDSTSAWYDCGNATTASNSKASTAVLLVSTPFLRNFHLELSEWHPQNDRSWCQNLAPMQVTSTWQSWAVLKWRPTGRKLPTNMATLALRIRKWRYDTACLFTHSSIRDRVCPRSSLNYHQFVQLSSSWTAYIVENVSRQDRKRRWLLSQSAGE